MLDLRRIRDAWPEARLWFSAFVLYAVGALVGTWPLMLRISTHLPTGTLGNATVPFFNLWTLEWNAHSLARGYSGYWEAPIFYPTPGTFALSEAQALTGLVFVALTAAVSGITAYNVIVLAALIANALAARRLFVVLGVSEVAATAAGLLALGMPFVWKELGVLQLTMLWPVWLALAELAILSGAAGVVGRESASRPRDSRAAAPSSGEHASVALASGVERADTSLPEPRSGAAFVRLAIWCSALVWTCTYYALFSGLFFFLAGVTFVRRAFFRGPSRAALLLAILILVGASYPLVAQQRVVGSYSRSSKIIHDGGATLRAYTRLPRGTLAGRVVSPLAATTERRSLYPGTLISIFAALGMWSRLARVSRSESGDSQHAGSREPRGGPRLPNEHRESRLRKVLLGIRSRLLAPGETRFFLWCGICLVLALVLSFGARWSIGSFRPYEALVERYVPGFANARSPYRFAAFVQVFLLVYAGLGLERALRAPWRGALPGRGRPALLMAVAAVGCLEPMVVEAPLQRFPVESLSASWIDWLAGHPGGAVAMVPPALTGKAGDFEPTTVAMLQAFRHGHPLLNGYSGFFPATADAYLDALKQFPNPRSKRLLPRVPVRYAVVDKAWLGPRTAAELAPLISVFDSPTHAIYLVPAASR